jgi:hypothetical protein
MIYLIINEGLIQNEEADTVALVKSMAEHYTKKENTIILTTIPMSGTCMKCKVLIYGIDKCGDRRHGKSAIHDSCQKCGPRWKANDWQVAYGVV